MTLVPKQLGADRKKLAYLGILLVVLVGVFLWNREPSSPEAHTASPLNVSPVVPAPGRPAASSSPAVPPRAPGRSGIRPVEDFKPSLKPKEGVDISKTDPSLKLDLLAKLKSVPFEIGPRGSVFDWGKAPPPPPQAVAILHPGPMPPMPPKPTTTAAGTDAAKPAIPPATPIPLKFYGYSAKSGTKRAFFLDGDDIAVAGENDVIKNRYKIVKIGVNSVVVEDLNNKNQQTLPLVEELAG
jgi:hypothetical protein